MSNLTVPTDVLTILTDLSRLEARAAMFDGRLAGSCENTASDVEDFAQHSLAQRKKHYLHELELELNHAPVDEDGCSTHEDDPEQLVVDDIARVAERIRKARRQMALLVAYAREFTPDPPRIAHVAAAAQVSKSQVARMYGDSEICEIEVVLGVTAPRTVRASLAERREAADPIGAAQDGTETEDQA